MTSLVGLVGSLRAGSANRQVFAAAQTLVPEGVRLVEAPLRDVPFYDGDVEEVGAPAAVAALREQVEAADAVVLFTPEYNRGVPAVMKNAVDWLSRMPGDSTLSRATVGVVAATPGRHDASGVRGHLADSLTGTTGRFYEASLGIASIGHVMADGAFTDPDVQAALRTWLADFVTFAAS